MGILDSNSGAAKKDANAACAEWQPLLMLFAAGDELDPAEQRRLISHLTECPACSRSLEEEKKFLGIFLGNRAEPDASLLAACRADLSDALDREEERGWLRRTFGLLLPASWLSPRPAWSAAVLLVIGFSVGILAPRLLRHTAAPVSAENASPVASATASDLAASSSSTNSSNTGALASLSPALDLRSADVAGINVLPSSEDESPRVELQLRAQQPVTLRGTVDDANVRQALLDALQQGDRVCPDIRLDAVDLLRACSNDPAVRSALCHTVHTDSNAAVRLKALEALDGAEPADIVRQTLLDALVDDGNPGVRVEAIDELRDLASRGRVTSDDQLVSVLRERMQNDPNTYIRLQSAAVMRELGPREKF